MPYSVLSWVTRIRWHLWVEFLSKIWGKPSSRNNFHNVVTHLLKISTTSLDYKHLFLCPFNKYKSKYVVLIKYRIKLLNYNYHILPGKYWNQDISEICRFTQVSFFNNLLHWSVERTDYVYLYVQLLAIEINSYELQIIAGFNT